MVKYDCRFSKIDPKTFILGVKMVTESSIKEILKSIVLPRFNNNLIDSGFFKGADIHGDHIHIKIEYPAPLGKAEEEIKQQIKDAIHSIEGAEKMRIEINDSVTVETENKAKKVLPNVKNVIAVASGKGGVGKSTTTANIAAALAQFGHKVGILDADIYGPSIPMMFNIEEQLQANESNMIIPRVRNGIAIVSVGLLANRALIWRGPMVHQMVHAFLTQVAWGELDYLIIDLPPGTGDAHLTITQTAPISGAVIVSTPQNIALEDARKGVNMFQQVQVPLLGFIETMSYFVCDNCDKQHDIFKTGGTESLAEELKQEFLGKVPFCKEVVIAGDHGMPVVLSDPESPAAVAYKEVTKKMIASLEALGNRKSEFSMDW